MSSPAVRIGIPRGAYPERDEAPPSWLDRAATSVAGTVARRVQAWARRWGRLVEPVAAHGAAIRALDAAEIRREAAGLRTRLRREGFRDELVARTFALVREAAGRTLGTPHFDVQIIGGWVLLSGMVAEMETGEGKTLTATLAASAAALAGLPVHIVTVNDYLARRDAEWMGPVYEALGLSVGVIVHGMDPEARRAAYASDVTYCTNKEVAFDYLKDRIVLGDQPNRIQLQLERLYGGGRRTRQLLHRGLFFAIVDEADSVLVDEARTPLIISGGGGERREQQVYQTALALAERLERDRDFVLQERERSVELTPAGQARLEELTASLAGVWRGRQRREDLVRGALTAHHLILRDKHYLVKDGTVQIIDEFTGRAMPDRSWEHGLHQLIEAKEGATLTSRNDPLARISYQRFFRRYLRLAGMTGTAREVAGELWAVYGLPVVRVPTNRPMVRRGLPDHVARTDQEKWAVVTDRIAGVHAAGRPVLVGTRSVAASEHLSGLLTAAGLPHEVLNARQDRQEAEVIARAGEPGRIMVATNMAGRGTDIRLAPGVAERGGLHVIATERHEAGRIDRQLFGRCGRQGDPGTYEAVVSLEDELARVHGRRPWRWLAETAARAGWRAWPRIGGWSVRRAQRAAERLHSRMRRDLLKYDEQLETTLAFSGRLE
ncbi:MAG TPA: preprotein translocase subunit SecA [Methylomirabilota bacterium]|nr:preprotein translocase subunit SecA [Methylomirabilota bacterium]